MAAGAADMLPGALTRVCGHDDCIVEACLRQHVTEGMRGLGPTERAPGALVPAAVLA